MKIFNRFLLVAGCILLFGISWLITFTKETDTEKQRKLIDEAENYLADKIYVYSVPLLEEAAQYEGEYTDYAEKRLKGIYTDDLTNSDYREKYEKLLIKQMSRENAPDDVFLEAAEFYFNIGESGDAFSVLRNGIAVTKSEDIVKQYESVRYRFIMGGNIFEYASETYGGVVRIKRNGKWGAASKSGSVVIPCEYDNISTWSGDRFIVEKDGEIYAINSGNDRIALLHSEADGFGNISQNRLGILSDGTYILSDGGFNISNISFEELGMFSENYAPAKVNGKWGLIGLDGIEWLLKPKYQDIIRDELGRALMNNSIFVRRDDGTVILLSGGSQTGGPYEDAKPFGDGWAAVKLNGKWGFVDTQGKVMIDFRFDDALSFGQHLAAVKLGDLWGYVSLNGEIAIEPQFHEVRSFYNGSAAVLTTAGWQFITLLEYQKG